MVVDLRGNGGGLLEEAKTLSGLFIDTGPVVQVKELFGVKHLDDDDEGTAWDGPLVVLIDKFSASAVGDLRRRDQRLRAGLDHRRRQHVRQRDRPADRHDQRPHPPARPPDTCANRGALKLTIQQFYRANGESTQINGVAPHHPYPVDERSQGHVRRRQDGQCRSSTTRLAACRTTTTTESPLIWSHNLRSGPSERRKSEPKFQKLDEQIKKFIERKARHSISLNEAKFRSEYVPEDPEEKAAEEKAKKDRKKKKYAEREVWAVRLLQ